MVIVKCPNADASLSATRPPASSMPAEVGGWTRYETPPEVVARARRAFDPEDHLAEMREVERTGGVRFEDFIGEVEERAARRE